MDRNIKIASEALNRIWAYCQTGWPQKDIGDIAKNALHALGEFDQPPNTQMQTDKDNRCQGIIEQCEKCQKKNNKKLQRVRYAHR